MTSKHHELSSASACSDQDTHFMERAIALAKQGLYTTNPNPRVGCVLVKDGRIIGEGFHRAAGEPHAEVMAYKNAIEDPQGATAYVTLEPCAHFGRTPPCVDKVISMKASRVVIAMIDPNPQVAGSSVKKLQEHGIDVTYGVCESAARALNPGFIQRMQDGKPYIRAKLAMSLDGKTAMKNGESQWITDSVSRHDVQHWRARSSAIITGINTLLDDNARLNVRLDTDVKQPTRIVFDTHARLPSSHPFVDVESPIIWVTHTNVDAKHALLSREHIIHWQLPIDEQGISLRAFLDKLQTTECNELLIEAGATLTGSFMMQNLVDELVLYIAPKILGHEARNLVNLPGLVHIDDAKKWQLIDNQTLNADARLIFTKKNQ
ncbi:MAG: bifunctional diaminohydroxyphosphoribosylaminopyrimidine deaminase/5-amino-6-(5-phosphoribosylamino)uracil reductase RibD [Pseudomonadota bacterium]